jgi:hypothetical protein
VANWTLAPVPPMGRDCQLAGKWLESPSCRKRSTENCSLAAQSLDHIRGDLRPAEVSVK